MILVRLEKTRNTYVILGVVLGVLGVHNFYAGRYARGAGQFALTVLLGWIVVGVAASWIWAMIDLLTIETDATGKRLV
ncbi:MAG: NINE protein [Planctomycetota bacterium]